MSKQLTVIARIEAKPEYCDRVREEALKVIGPTRQEEGCIQYELHQDNTRPELLMFFEVWADRGLWQHHSRSAHLKAFITSISDLIVDLQVSEMTQIG